MNKSYKIDVDCAACALEMENVLKKCEGIKDASINFMLQKVNITFEDGVLEKEVLKNAIKKCRDIEEECEIYYE